MQIWEVEGTLTTYVSIQDEKASLSQFHGIIILPIRTRCLVINVQMWFA
uniref:Uncharacterized protein n=1 Tax=Setaria italica TaxID=4555 RepID=K4APH7_SETIT